MFNFKEHILGESVILDGKRWRYAFMYDLVPLFLFSKYSSNYEIANFLEREGVITDQMFNDTDAHNTIVYFKNEEDATKFLVKISARTLKL